MKDYLRIFFGIDVPESRTIETRQTYLRTGVLLAMPMTMIFVVVNALNDFPGLALVEAISLMFLIAAHFMGKHEKWINIAEYLAIAYGVIITKGLLIFGGIEGSGVLWIYTFPFLVFMVKGQRVGWVVTVIWLIVMASSLNIGIPYLEYYPYATNLKPQLTLSMFFYAMIASAFSLERNRYEILLQKQLEEAKSEAEFRSRFLSNVSHEIRTPLNAIYNLADFASQNKDPQRHKEFLHKLKHSTKRLLLLLNNVLDFSKLESKETVVEHAIFDLHEEIHSLEESYQETCNSKNIRFEVNIDDKAPILVISDIVKIYQILHNLLNNAIKFTPTGGKVELSIKLMQMENNVASLLFTVSDTGIGMDEAQASTVFEAFKQADTSTTRKFGGTGLGLAITRELIKALQGSIWVESKPGLGSQFKFALSLETASNKLKTVLDNQDLLEDNSNEEILFKKPIRILLVEDDELNRFIALEIFKIHNVTLVTANNGQDALDLLREDHAFDIILMDFAMPFMDGFQTTSQIKQNPALQHIPVVGLTANVASEEIQKGLTSGMIDVVSKPIVKADLFYTILLHLPNAENSTAESKLELHDPEVQDNPELVEKIIDIFTQQYSDFYRQGMDMLELQDLASLSRKAHTLKGHLAYFKKVELANMAKQLEQACDDHSDTTEEILQQLCSELEPLIQQMQQNQSDS